jgi:hypothetical protein
MLGVSMKIGRETLGRLTRELSLLCQGAVRSPLRSGVKINQPPLSSTLVEKSFNIARPWLAVEAMDGSEANACALS